MPARGSGRANNGFAYHHFSTSGNRRFPNDESKLIVLAFLPTVWVHSHNQAILFDPNPKKLISDAQKPPMLFCRKAPVEGVFCPKNQKPKCALPSTICRKGREGTSPRATRRRPARHRQEEKEETPHRSKSATSPSRGALCVSTKQGPRRQTKTSHCFFVVGVHLQRIQCKEG
jgi:hypothetical protein